MATATRDMTAPVIPWDDFTERLDWRQAEHVTIIGPTGSGKTTLSLALLPRRSWVCALGTKPRDDVLEGLITEDGYRRAYEWPPPVTFPRVVLWPDVSRVGNLPKLREVFARAFADMYEAGGWCVYLNEVWVVAKFLGMSRTTELLLQQGRSNRLTVVGETQRPTFIPLAFYSQATHLFLFQTNDARDLKRLSEIGGRADVSLVRRTVASLGWHDFLYVNTRTGETVVSRVDD